MGGLQSISNGAYNVFQTSKAWTSKDHSLSMLHWNPHRVVHGLIWTPSFSNWSQRLGLIITFLDRKENKCSFYLGFGVCAWSRRDISLGFWIPTIDLTNARYPYLCRDYYHCFRFGIQEKRMTVEGDYLATFMDDVTQLLELYEAHPES